MKKVLIIILVLLNIVAWGYIGYVEFGKEWLEQRHNGTIVYFNPETGLICDDYIEENSTTENKSGCLKWYMFNNQEDATTVNLLLAHNTTAQINWSSTISNNTNGDVVNARLKEDVVNWHPNVRATARLIRADEVARIARHRTFNVKTTHINHEDYMGEFWNEKSCTIEDTTGVISNCKYGWLYDRLYSIVDEFEDASCTLVGCLNDPIGGMPTIGYWTSSPTASRDNREDNDVFAWYIWGSGAMSPAFVNCNAVINKIIDARLENGEEISDKEQELYDRTCSPNNTAIGIRPVITISKSILR